MEYASDLMQDREADWQSRGMIGKQIAKIPRQFFFGAAGFSIGASLLLQLFGRKNESLFVGQWAPTFLVLGVYDELIRQRTAQNALRRTVH